MRLTNYKYPQPVMQNEIYKSTNEHSTHVSHVNVQCKPTITRL